jgi:predicted ester cyclase
VLVVSAQDNKAVVRRLIEEAYNRADLDVADELVAQDVFNHAAVPKHRHGIDGFKHVIEWMRGFSSDVHYEIEDLIAEGEKVAVRMPKAAPTRARSGASPNGKRFSVDYVHWFRLADGKVAEPWAVRDDLSRLEQLDLIAVLGET